MLVLVFVGFENDKTLSIGFLAEDRGQFPK